MQLHVLALHFNLFIVHLLEPQVLHNVIDMYYKKTSLPVRNIDILTTSQELHSYLFALDFQDHVIVVYNYANSQIPEAKQRTPSEGEVEPSLT